MSYVYVISNEEPLENPRGTLTGVEHVKIGFTRGDVDSRIAQLQTGNPRKLHLVYLYEFKDADMARQAERMCHWALRGLVVSGEWFYYDTTVAFVLKALELLSEFSSYTFPDEEAYANLRVVSNGQ